MVDAWTAKVCDGGCPLHGSAGNITPQPRAFVYLNVNSVESAATKLVQLRCVANRDFAPLQPFADDCLLVQPEHQTDRGSGDRPIGTVILASHPGDVGFAGTSHALPASVSLAADESLNWTEPPYDLSGNRCVSRRAPATTRCRASRGKE